MENSVFLTFSEIAIKQEKLDDDASSTANNFVITHEVKQEPEVNFVCILPDIESGTKGHDGGKSGEKVEKIDKGKVLRKKAELNNNKSKLKPVKRKFVCKYCENFYAVKKDRQKHISTDHSSIFQCIFCPRAFSRPNYLKSHLRTHEEKPTFLCWICGRQLTTQAYLKRHILTHSSELPYHCDKCPKRFKTRKYISRHVLIHTPPERVKCEFCPTRVQRTNMKFHLYTHGKKPYKCDFCSATFAQRNKLTYHRRTHFGDKPFDCSLCSQKFTYNQTLIDHFKLSHTNFVLSCEVCLKIYKSKQGLRSHMLHFHQQSFVCDLCGFERTTKLQIQKHIDSVHIGVV